MLCPPIFVSVSSLALASSYSSIWSFATSLSPSAIGYSWIFGGHVPQVERSCDLAWEVMAFWDCLTLAFVWCRVSCVVCCFVYWDFTACLWTCFVWLVWLVCHLENCGVLPWTWFMWRGRGFVELYVALLYYWETMYCHYWIRSTPAENEEARQSRDGVSALCIRLLIWAPTCQHAIMTSSSGLVKKNLWQMLSCFHEGSKEWGTQDLVSRWKAS